MAATSIELMEAMADQLTTELAAVITNLQVVGGWRLSAPTPPTIDVFPPDDEPFYNRSGYGSSDYDFVYVVRARVTTADQPEGQKFLLAMMDPNSPESVARALESDLTLNGKAQDLTVDAPSEFGLYPDAAHQGGLLGCTWRTVVTV